MLIFLSLNKLFIIFQLINLLQLRLKSIYIISNYLLIIKFLFLSLKYIYFLIYFNSTTIQIANDV